MLKKGARLRRELFKNLLDSRRFFHTEHFLLRSADSPSGPRIGVSVPKKVAKQAVLRNRTRRRAYAAVEDLVKDLPKKVYLVIAKPGAQMLRGDALRRELAELLKKG